MEDIYMVLGGTHLANVSKERLAFTVEQIKKMGKLYVELCIYIPV